MTLGTSTGESFESMYDLLMGNERGSTSDEASDNSQTPIISDNSRDLVVIRHGETKYNDQDLERGWSDVPLTPEGREEATKLGDNLKDQPDVLVSSDLKRAEDTANIISKQSGVPLAETNPSLRTWNIGDWEGKPCSEIDPIRQKYVINPDLVPPNGESFNQFKTRVLGGVEDILGRYNGKVGLVTHSKVQQLLDATEAGDWQHIDANHFNDKPEAPGKEKTMSIPEAMLMPTDEAARALEYIKAGPANRYLNFMQNQLNKMKQDNFNPFNFSSRKTSENIPYFYANSEKGPIYLGSDPNKAQDTLDFINDRRGPNAPRKPLQLLPGPHPGLEGSLSGNTKLAMSDEFMNDATTEGEIKNLKYGIPAAGAGRARTVAGNMPDYVSTPANENSLAMDRILDSISKGQTYEQLLQENPDKANIIKALDDKVKQEEQDPYNKAVINQNRPKPYLAVDNPNPEKPISTIQQLEDWFKEKYPNLDK